MQYENFDQLALAKLTQQHDMLEFRRISSFLYRRIGKYEFSIELSKVDGIYRVSLFRFFFTSSFLFFSSKSS